MLSDKELISQCKEGNRKAQYELYQRFSGELYVVCLRYCKAQQEAEDVLQESFIKIFRCIKDFRGDSALKTWMKRIVINTSLNQLRNKLYLFPMSDVEENAKVEIPFCADGHSLDDLLSMMEELPTGCRVIFNLYAVEGYKHNEIAEMLGVSEGTSKSQLSRAKSLLKNKILEQNEPNYGKVGR
ncbi:MAG: RNA polymerase sigma factor [Bacteroidota bacterium]